MARWGSNISRCKRRPGKRRQLSRHHRAQRQTFNIKNPLPRTQSNFTREDTASLGIRAITAVEGTGCWRVFPHLNQFGIDIGNLEYKLASLSDSNDDCRIKNYYISVICKSILIPLALTVPLLYIPIGTLLTLPRSSPLASSSSSSHARCSSNTSHYSLLLPTFSPLYQIGYAAVAPIPMISSRAVEM